MVLSFHGLRSAGAFHKAGKSGSIELFSQLCVNCLMVSGANPVDTFMLCSLCSLRNRSFA